MNSPYVVVGGGGLTVVAQVIIIIKAIAGQTNPGREINLAWLLNFADRNLLINCHIFELER